MYNIVANWQGLSPLIYDTSRAGIVCLNILIICTVGPPSEVLPLQMPLQTYAVLFTQMIQ